MTTGNAASLHALSAERFAAGVQQGLRRQLAAPVAVGHCCRAAKGLDRYVIKRTTISGEPLMLVLVLEGVGAPNAVNWCEANLLKLFVHYARDDASGASLQKAGRAAFEQAHNEASGAAAETGLPSACMVTLCAVNSLRDEVTTCNVGASAAILTSRGRTSQLTDDHRIESSHNEQRRLHELGVHLQCAQDRHGQLVPPLRAWPQGVDPATGLVCARAIGTFGRGVDPRVISPVPTTSTLSVQAQGGDLLVCSDGVWNELLLPAVASLARTCPTPQAVATLVVERACSQRTSYSQTGFGMPEDDTTCVCVRIGPSAANSAAARKRRDLEAPAVESKSSRAAALFKRTSSNFLKRAWGMGGGALSHFPKQGLAGLGQTPCFTPSMSTPGTLTPHSEASMPPTIPPTPLHTNGGCSPATSPADDDELEQPGVGLQQGGTPHHPLHPPLRPAATVEVTVEEEDEEEEDEGMMMMDEDSEDSSSSGAALAVALPRAAHSMDDSSLVSPPMPPPALASGAVATPAGSAAYSSEEEVMIARLQGSFAALKIKTLLGEGGTAQVWHAEWAGTQVCVKVMRGCHQERNLQRFLSEIAIWRELRHPNVCSLLTATVHESRPSMVLEFMAGGSLDRLLHSSRDGFGDEVKDELEPSLVKRVVGEVAAGLAYLHAYGVMHRDVKSANVLLDETNHAKLTDFGVSTRSGRDEYTAETGTYRNMAPEVILHKPYDSKCDIYSFGILVWECLHRQVPFAGLAPLQAAFAVAMQFARPAIDLRPEFEAYEQLIVKCWDADPAVRPDMPTVVKITSDLLHAASADPSADPSSADEDIDEAEGEDNGLFALED